MYVCICTLCATLYKNLCGSYEHYFLSVLQCILLVVMFVEALVVLGRGTHHLRVTRALRPLFLVDTILLQDVRRYILCTCMHMLIIRTATNI